MMRDQKLLHLSFNYKVEEDLKRIAEKFRNTDNQDVTMEEGAMCGTTYHQKKRALMVKN